MDKNNIILDNSNIIKKAANKYLSKVRYLGIEFDDLYQEGVLSVYSSLDNYDSSKGSLSNYIYQMASYAMLNYITNNATILHVPASYLTEANAFINKNRAFYNEHNRNMNMDECIEYINTYGNISGSKKDKDYVSNLKNIADNCFNNKIERFGILESYDAIIGDVEDSNGDFTNYVVGLVISENVVKYLSEIAPEHYKVYVEKKNIDGNGTLSYDELIEKYDSNFNEIKCHIQIASRLVKLRGKIIRKMICE